MKIIHDFDTLRFPGCSSGKKQFTQFSGTATWLGNHEVVDTLRPLVNCSTLDILNISEQDVVHFFQPKLSSAWTVRRFTALASPTR
jgi:hypothetical protein